MKKILAVASQGGHLVQLMRLKRVFDCYETYYVSNAKDVGLFYNLENYFSVKDASLSKKFDLIGLAFKIFIIVLRVRPDVVISTGAAPGFFALMFGKILGAKTIWIDSIANAESLSVSGDKVGKFSDLRLTQWEHLSDKSKKISYFGRVL